MERLEGGTHTLEKVEEEKDLGVKIDSKLTISKHIQAQVNKANSTLGAIKHTFKTLDKDSFLRLYKGIIRPHLEYASVIWSPRWKKDKNALEQVQRRATRLVHGLSHLSYPQRLARLQLPTLEYWRQRADIIQAFKIIRGFDSVQSERESAMSVATACSSFL